MMAKRKKVPAKAAALGGALLIALLSCAGVTAARYVMQKRQSGIMTAKEFYFASDLLKEPQENAVYYIDPGARTFSVTLLNHADSQRMTPMNIVYNVSVANGTADVMAGTIVGNEQNEAVITLTPSTADNSADITVTAAATSPYEKTLQAVFKRSLGNEYTVSDQPGNMAAVLTMTCADSDKDIKITLPDGLIADESDSRMSYDNGTYIFASPGQGVYSVTLLKTGMQKNYSSSGPFADAIKIQDQ